MSNIQGKVVVITGASSGLGEATARHLAAKGAKVFLGARRMIGSRRSWPTSSVREVRPPR